MAKEWIASREGTKIEGGEGVVVDLLDQRKTTHGSFEQNAAISQAIKHVFHSYGRYPTENPTHCEALDMIALKLSRILSGHNDFDDHWADLAGYSELARKACRAR